jgi:hypothetical protein
MKLSKVTRILATINLSSPIGYVLMIGGAVCLIKGAYELIKAAKAEGAREELLGVDPDEEDQPESPKTLKSIAKAARKKVDRILLVYGEGINWILAGFDCLMWMDALDGATAVCAAEYASKWYDTAMRERKLKEDLRGAVCKFSHKVSDAASDAFNIAEGMDRTKMGYKFVRQKARTLDTVGDWMEELLDKPMIAAGAIRS